MIAEKYGQDPRAVAEWEPEWLAAATTIMVAEHGAARERAKRDERRANLRGIRGG